MENLKTEKPAAKKRKPAAKKRKPVAVKNVPGVHNDGDAMARIEDEREDMIDQEQVKLEEMLKQQQESRALVAELKRKQTGKPESLSDKASLKEVIDVVNWLLSKIR
jgi:hypothetical protein